MCYDAEAQLTRQIKDAINEGAPADEVEAMRKQLWELTIERLREKDPAKYDPKNFDPDVFDPDKFNPYDEDFDDHLPRYYHVNGFEHPKFIMLTDPQRPRYAVAEWGFVHTSAKTLKDAYHSYDKPWMNNLNAQSESMFDKPTFAQSARFRRCAISLDAYYERHHAAGKTIPFRVAHKDGSSMWIAGIFNKNELVDEETGEIVRKNTLALLTCRASTILQKIHNNPKVIQRAGPRMLVILDKQQLKDFLKPFPRQSDPDVQQSFEKEILKMCRPYNDELLEFRSVKALKRGGESNTPDAIEEHWWSNLNYEKLGLTPPTHLAGQSGKSSEGQTNLFDT